MTLVTESLDRIARQCSVKAPSSWVSATRTDHVEIKEDFLLETVQDILDRVDLPARYTTSTTYSEGGGTTNADGSESFDLPSVALRLQRGPYAVYDELQDRPCVPISTDGEWTNITDVGSVGSVKIYRLRGWPLNWKIDIYRMNGDVTVHYITNYWMANSSGTAGSSFTAEDDELLLPRTVVESGTTYRFRQRRGLDYMDKFMEYEAKIARMINDSRGRRKINCGVQEPVKWTRLVPAWIPDS